MDLIEERCRRHGLVLLGDAAHGFDSQFGGRKIGTFGTASVFSLGKHLEIPGGILSFRDSGRREHLARRANEELRKPRSLSVVAYRWITFLKAFTGRRRAPRWVARVWNATVLDRDVRDRECVQPRQAPGNPGRHPVLSGLGPSGTPGPPRQRGTSKTAVSVRRRVSLDHLPESVHGASPGPPLGRSGVERDRP